jgi:WS/DGAT/MGAT family acyltransferase
MDSAFLALETPTTPLQVTGVVRLDTGGTAPAEYHRRLRTHLEERLQGLPELRSALAPGPLQADGAAWRVEPEIDLDRHLHRAALPAPGDEAMLDAFVADRAARPLDRSRPLWDMWLVEGLSDGHLALVASIHHAVVDGLGAAALLARLCDAADVGDLGAADARSTPSARAPAAGWWATPARAVRSLLATPGQVTRQTLQTAGAGLRYGLDRLRRSSAAASALPLTGPDTPINGAITSERAVALGEVPLARLQRIKRRFDGLDVTINDVVLAACTDALRRYLGRFDQPLPSRPLVAAIPVSIDRSKVRAANALSSIFVHLPVHLPDPVERLRFIQRSAGEAKRLHEQVGHSLLHDWAEAAPGFLLDGLSNLYARLDLADRHAPLCNVVISNVRGPAAALYCAGARVEACHPLGPIFEGAALNLTVLSYGGRVFFGAVGCPAVAPALERLPGDFRAAVDGLLRGSSGPVRAAAPPRARRAHRATTSSGPA